MCDTPIPHDATNDEIAQKLRHNGRTLVEEAENFRTLRGADLSAQAQRALDSAIINGRRVSNDLLAVLQEVAL